MSVRGGGGGWGGDERYIHIVWCYLFTLHRKLYPGSNTFVPNPCYIHTYTHIQITKVCSQTLCNKKLQIEAVNEGEAIDTIWNFLSFVLVISPILTCLLLSAR